MCGIQISPFHLCEDIAKTSIQCFLCCVNSFISIFTDIHTFRLSASWRMSIVIWGSKYPHKIGKVATLNSMTFSFSSIFRVSEFNANSHGQCHLCVSKYPQKVSPAHPRLAHLNSLFTYSNES